MILYHLDRAGTLAEGQIISPGPVSKLFPDIRLSQFGETILREHHAQSGPRVLDWDNMNTLNLEMHSETIRRRYFPLYPSRLSVFYCVRSLSDLIVWNKYFPLSPESRICEIEYDGPLNEFDAFFLRGITLPVELVSPNLDQLDENIKQTQKNLFLYWSGARSEHPFLEVLVPLPVTILRVASLDSYPDSIDFIPLPGKPS